MVYKINITLELHQHVGPRRWQSCLNWPMLWLYSHQFPHLPQSLKRLFPSIYPFRTDAVQFLLQFYDCCSLIVIVRRSDAISFRAVKLFAVLYVSKRWPTSNDTITTTSSSYTRLIMICLSFLLILLLLLLLLWMFLDLLSAKCSVKTVSALLTIIAFIQIFHIIKVLLCVKLLPVYFECFGWLYSMNTLISFRGISVAIKCVELLLLCFTNYFRRILIHVHS